VENPTPRASPDSPLLEVRDLSVSLLSDAGRTEVTRGVSFDVARGGVTAIVGESGSGKSVTAFSILGLLPAAGRIEKGTITFQGRELTRMKEHELRRVRGGEISLVFQEPMSALNPVYTAGAQIVEAIRLHSDMSRGEAKRHAIDWLARVGMPEPERRFDSYPHELSGGMRQRTLLAMALAPKPKLLILDEPTSALDRSVEAEILGVIASMRETIGLSVLFISHDLAVVSEVADRIVVMYAGEVVEDGSAKAIIEAPQHPYTQALLAAIPREGERPPRKLGDHPSPLRTIEGSVPDLAKLPVGCRFQTRCPHRFDACSESDIPLFETAAGHARCLLVAPSKQKLALDAEPSLALDAEDE